MVIFQAKKDVANRRRVVLKGRIVTIIDIAGREAKIAEDGQWYKHSEFHPLVEEDIQVEHINAVIDKIAGKSIATLKPLDTGFQFVLEDNTRVDVRYGAGEELNVIVYDSNGERVL
jgi:hypothetical protein